MRITLLDTCYLHGGIGRPPNEVQRRFSDGDGRAVGRASGRPRDALVADGRGSAPRSTRSAPSTPADDARSSARGRPSGASPLHAHVSEQPAENEDCRRRVRPDARRGPGRRPGSSASGSPPCTPPTSPPTTSRRSVAAHVCLCPTTERDLADGIGPPAALVAAGAALCLGLGLPRRDRPVRGGAGGGARRAAGHRRPRPPHRRRRCWRRPRPAARGRSAGPTPAGSSVGALADLTVVDLDSVRLAGAAPDHLVEAAVFAAGGAPTSRHVMVGGRWIVRDGEHVSVPVGAALAEADRARCGRRVTTLVVDRIGLLVTNDPDARRRAARAGARRRGRDRGRTGRWPSTAAGAGGRRAGRRGGPLRRARLRRQPHAPGVRGRPGRGVHRPHGRPALRRAAASASPPRRPAPRSDDDLRRRASARLAEARAGGTTHVEIKSGYALDVEGEARLAAWPPS